MQSVKCWMSSFNFLSLWQACDYIKEVITLFTDSAVWHLHEILATALLLTPSNKADTHLLPPQTFFPVDWTQDLMHASQMLNHWSHKPTPFLGILFLKQGLILSRLTLNLRSSYQHLPSSWNHSMHHLVSLYLLMDTSRILYSLYESLISQFHWQIRKKLEFNQLVSHFLLSGTSKQW
jgi:hypothetical protein